MCDPAYLRLTPVVNAAKVTDLAYAAGVKAFYEDIGHDDDLCEDMSATADSSLHILSFHRLAAWLIFVEPAARGASFPLPPGLLLVFPLLLSAPQPLP